MARWRMVSQCGIEDGIHTPTVELYLAPLAPLPRLCQRERGPSPVRSALTVHIRLHRLGVLGAREGLAVGHPHHIGKNLQAVAVRIEEIERATAAAAQVPAPL